MGYITNIYASLSYKVALLKLDIYSGLLKKGKLFLEAKIEQRESK